MRRFVIGDIHGAYLALKQVLDRAGFNYEEDQLIAVGDVCDGWPDTHKCIEELMSIKNLVYCRGNHDDWAIRYLQKKDVNSMEYESWLVHGGRATQISYEKNPDLLQKHINWLKKSVVYHIDSGNRLYLHAGFNPAYEIDDQPVDRVYTTSDGVPAIYFWDRTFWKDVSQGFIDPLCDSFKEIYIGHTPTVMKWRHGRPVRFGNICNMDTGAAFVGKLSMTNIETGELYQSDPVFQLYPEHPGRNGTLLMQGNEWKELGLFL
jgi:serine/threonine protein phosphatase 1